MDHIIDIHAHLGDICFPGGGELIGKTGVKSRNWIDIISISEWFFHRFAPDDSYFGSWLHQKEIQSSLKRNFTGSLQNFLRSMKQASISHSVSLPVPPNVIFSDIQSVAEKHPSIIPFTGVDFSREYDVEAELRNDVKAGAKGMKLHPILQCEKLTSQKTYEAVEAFALHDLPVLLHTGVCYYYTTSVDKQNREKPLFGDIKDVLKLIADFSDINFIMGHAGLLQWDELKQSVRSFKNIWVDGTFKSPTGIRELVRVLGADKVLFGSDWPWGNRKPALKILKRACKNDYHMERKILFENAAELMGLSF